MAAANAPESGLMLVACGALALELPSIKFQFPESTVDITCLPVSWHNHPEHIVLGLRRKVASLRREACRVAVFYGDCGTGGEIDAFLNAEKVDRISGPHCYEMFMGPSEFDAEIECEFGTFFLTEYMVRHFERIVIWAIGLRKHPQLRDMYFGNYSRGLFIAQIEDKTLQAKARATAAELGLAYKYHFTGFGGLPAWGAASVSADMPAEGD